MVRFTTILVVLGGLSAAFATVDVTGIYGIVERRMPQHVGKFSFEATEGEGDTFVVSDTEGVLGGITVTCTTASACARGLYKCVEISPSLEFVGWSISSSRDAR
jgi:alpha-N-acetylglucosaminidase